MTIWSNSRKRRDFRLRNRSLIQFIRKSIFDRYSAIETILELVLRFEPLIRKLETVASLSAEERSAVVALCGDVRDIPRRRDIAKEGTVPDRVHLILEGWAARYSILANGSRRITAFLLPGDFCDIHITTMAVMDHSILAITDCAVAFVDPDQIDELTRSTPALTKAFWRSALIDESILRQWLVNAGRQSAVVMVGQLLCELHARMNLVGLAGKVEFGFPLTQEFIADATGLTPVHVNRMLRELRERGLVVIKDGNLDVPDIGALAKASDFNPRYLHLRQPK
ncbi:Crp/Fnr family transcriptional regulator [Sphingomonas sp. GB1N7]|uniref:Crp/Fnr family transcriptional regulator n=1 Tax=Parasphingomonas caseinilytica TaxID=3096158 RepID=UPI002FC5F6E9